MAKSKATNAAKSGTPSKAEKAAAEKRALQALEAEDTRAERETTTMSVALADAGVVSSAQLETVIEPVADPETVAEAVQETPATFDFADAALGLLEAVGGMGSLETLELAAQAKREGVEKLNEAKAFDATLAEITKEYGDLVLRATAAKARVEELKNTVRLGLAQQELQSSPDVLIRTAGDLVEATKGTIRYKATLAAFDALVDLFMAKHAATEIETLANLEAEKAANRVRFFEAKAKAKAVEKAAEVLFDQSREAKVKGGFLT